MQYFSLEQGNASIFLALLYTSDWNDFNIPAKSNFYLAINIKSEKSNALYASSKMTGAIALGLRHGKKQ
jgi:hypothetical protein